MKILAIEASGLVAGVSVCTEDRVIVEYNLNTALTHSETLMPMVAQALSAAGESLSGMDYIACAQGPGSFTGLRIGAACAKALAHAADKPIVPVPTLAALAYNVALTNQTIIPMMDARRQQVYAAFYRYDAGGRLQTVREAAALGLTEVLDAAVGCMEGALFLGDGATAYQEELSTRAGFSLAPAAHRTQRAAAVGGLGLMLAKEGKAVSYDGFTLLYLRKPQAEREYEGKRES